MSASLHVPAFITGKTKEELIKNLLKVQVQQNGKVTILSIVQDLNTKEWVCWYLPIKHFGGGLM